MPVLKYWDSASGTYVPLLAGYGGITQEEADARYQPLGSAGAPVGAMQPYAGATAPTGWLLAQGQAVSRATYADLFAVCGTTYGVGDGSTTFNVPNMQGRMAVGLSQADTDPLVNTLGSQGGGMGSHSHGPGSFATPDHLHILNDSGWAAILLRGASAHIQSRQLGGASTTFTSRIPTPGVQASANESLAGGSALMGTTAGSDRGLGTVGVSAAADSGRPYYTTLNFIIKT